MLLPPKYPNRNWSHYKHAIAMKIGKKTSKLCALSFFQIFTASKKHEKICTVLCVCVCVFFVAVFVCLLFWGFSCILFQSFIYK